MSNTKSEHKSPPCNNDLAEENEILKIAVANIDLDIFVYEQSTRLLRFLDDKEPPLGLPKVVKEPSAYIASQNIIAHESIKALNDLFACNRAGELKVGATIKAYLDAEHKEYCWYNVVLINCCDPDGHVIRVVGTIQNVTDRIMTELKYSKEEQFRMAMMAENRRVYEINVTNDRFMYLESPSDSTDPDTWRPYSETMSRICSERIYKEDWERFLDVANRDNLLHAFASGKSEFYCEYRIMGDNGKLSWSCSTTHLLHDPVSGDIKGFIYAKDIDAQKKQEIILRRQAERDPLTGVFNRATAEKSIENILKKSNSKHLHGFLSIDVDDFKTVNDTFGHVQGDLLLTQIADGFASMLRSNDVLARMGGDEFIVFLANVGSVDRVHSIAERLRQFVHTLCLNGIEDVHFSISVGIAICPDNGTSFSELYKFSDAALYYAKQNGKNRVSSNF